VLLIVFANAYVLLKGDDSTSEVSAVARAEVAIVPGALVEPDGDMSSMLAARVEQASRLWHAGKVEKILVSGDHGSWIYDEPDTMRKALVAAGVAPRDVFEDHAGFDTWATMVRAREIFDVRDAVVVTQGFHMSRALYLADAAGIDCHRPHRRPADLGLPGTEELGARGALAGQGGGRRQPRYPGAGGTDDPDRDLRWPRELGPGAAGRNAAGRFA